ncbi:hypothetical protein SAMN05216587_101212 [Selenomonas ruminantium]|uniref:Uncharacterized protein n=2 Tax=Selenomonas ruminantium TaxID=971 RepID=A0A1I0V336_SELRU|nr:hypothetical protein SAMN05216587_101212 [Selenomonas ruminantium]
MRLGKIRSLAEYIVQHKTRALGAVILLEIMGIVVMQWLNNSTSNEQLEENYQRYMANHDAVITELNRIELARQEDLKPVEALNSMLMVMPEQVKCRHITIGNLHNGDWIVMEVDTSERNMLESYLSSIRRTPNFAAMRVEDLVNGVRITVPMPEGFVW